MTQNTKKLLDYLPLGALIISAVLLLISFFTSEISLQARHIAGLILLPVPLVAMLYRHKLGVLTLGLVLILGLFGAISFSPAIMTFTLDKTLWNNQTLTFLYLQPIFLLWFILHLILSGRYYTGVLSKKYWENIHSDEPFRIS